jgi:hypothetical protein
VTASNTDQVTFQVEVDQFCSASFSPDGGPAVVPGPPFTTHITTHFGNTCYGLHATARNTCGRADVDASPFSFTVDTQYGCVPQRPQRGQAAWSSDLSVEGGRLQVVVNGTAASFPGRGRGYGVAALRDGENRVDVTLLEGAGKPGLWRFDFMNAQAVVAGSIKPLSGDVVQVAAASATFRLSGKPGERIVFVFLKK